VKTLQTYNFDKDKETQKMSNQSGAQLLVMALRQFSLGNYKQAGALFSQSANLDVDKTIELLTGVQTSTSALDRSLPLGDKRLRFKKDLDEDFVDEVDSLEDIMPKNSEQQIQLIEDDADNPSFSSGHVHKKKRQIEPKVEPVSIDQHITNLKNDRALLDEEEELDQMWWEDANVVPPSISASQEKIVGTKKPQRISLQ
jgi:hypothetical protein